MTTNTEQLLREALIALEHHVAQTRPIELTSNVIFAIREHLTQPAQAGEADTGPRVLREVFALCEATEEHAAVPASMTEAAAFLRGRKFEAKAIRKAIGTWFQDEFCGRSFMGEPVTTPPASQEQAKWTDADSDAARLALELECLLLDTKDTAAVSRWWSSAFEALELHRARINASQEQAQQPSLICRTCGADRFKEPCKNATACTMVGEAQAQQPTPASAADMAVYQSIADGYLNAQQPSTAPKRCSDCGKALSQTEIEYYGSTCEQCEGKRFRAVESEVQQPSGGEVVAWVRFHSDGSGNYDGPLMDTDCRMSDTRRSFWTRLSSATPKPEPLPLPRLTVSDSHMESLIEAAIQGHASTRDAMRWLVRQLATKPEPMTAEQIVAIAATPCAIPGSYVYSLVRAVEAHHGITAQGAQGGEAK